MTNECNYQKEDKVKEIFCVILIKIVNKILVFLYILKQKTSHKKNRFFLYPDETLFSLIEYFSSMAHHLTPKRITISTSATPPADTAETKNRIKTNALKFDDNYLFNKELDYAKIIENSIEKRFEKLNKIEQQQQKINNNKKNNENCGDELNLEKNDKLDLCIKPKMINTQWALSKINTFDDDSKTFEIIEHLENKNPDVKKIGPTETMFAVMPNGTTICYITAN